ncbi:MAG: prepilin-type N-terminal cleavage/methylation domain-containing protein, partial [Ramlibacter sp.]
MNELAISISTDPIFRTRRRSEQGFTLIEMLVAVAIAAILTSIAAPSVAQLAASL